MMSQDEMMNVDGGFWSELAVGIVGCIVYAIGDEASKDLTGNSLARNAVDATKTAASWIGDKVSYAVDAYSSAFNWFVFGE